MLRSSSPATDRRSPDGRTASRNCLRERFGFTPGSGIDFDVDLPAVGAGPQPAHPRTRGRLARSLASAMRKFFYLATHGAQLGFELSDDGAAPAISRLIRMLAVILRARHAQVRAAA